MITHEVDLDMYPGVRVPVVVHVSQYDSDFSIAFKLYSSRGTFNMQSGTTATVRGTKRDGKGFSASASVSGNTVTVTGDQQMTAIKGANTFELSLTKSGKELNTSNFVLYVEPAALDRDTIVSESKIMELLDVTDQADDIIAAANLVEDTLESITYRDPNNDGNVIISMGVGS